MFQEYLGSGVSIVLWQIFVLIIGLILISKYFMAMLVKELDDSIRITKNDLYKNFLPDNQEMSKVLVKLSIFHIFF